MQAGETKLQPLIEGTKQFVVPLFQRPYSWDNKEWRALWSDLIELCEADNARPHFFGSIVTMPTVTVPEGVAKFLLIDGQQRLTTSFILLSLIRDIAKSTGKINLANEIENTLLLNPYKGGADRFKLMPTQADREAFLPLLEGAPDPQEGTNVERAYKFFEREYRKRPLDIETLKNAVCKLLSTVSIVLDANDNPHLVFEGLNAKGKPLSQADLIRNYFVMRIHADRQDFLYQKHWKPIQKLLSDQLTEFVRHFLMRTGQEVKLSDVYFVLKDQVTIENAEAYLDNLHRFARYYIKFLNPTEATEGDPEIRAELQRLRRLDIGVCHPFLLMCFDDYEEKRLTKPQLLEILKAIENFSIRRFVCNIPTYGLNKVFPGLYQQATNRSGDFVRAVCDVLQTKNYPKDSEFEQRLQDSRLYGAGDRTMKTKLILESIEQSYAHKEQVPFEALTIEHVMPQTLDEEWQDKLGEDWAITHDVFLHVLGNLTLTGYNAELSNSSYDTKRPLLASSHLELNSYFRDIPTWDAEKIEKRGEILAKRALELWPYFGTEPELRTATGNVAGRSPKQLTILGQRFDVGSWRDVIEKTFNTVWELEPEKFEVLMAQFPKLVGFDKSKFRQTRTLANGAYIEVHFAAAAIYRYCVQVIETIGLTADDWQVITD